MDVQTLYFIAIQITRLNVLKVSTKTFLHILTKIAKLKSIFFNEHHCFRANIIDVIQFYYNSEILSKILLYRDSPVHICGTSLHCGEPRRTNVEELIGVD